MPPRIPPSVATITSTAPSVHTHCKSCLHRAFSSTTIRSQTKLRQRFFAWLNGPGAVFKYPLPNSTNYLSAYDRRGNLLRGYEEQSSSNKERNVEEALTEDEEALEAAAEETGRKLRPETVNDLRPFPNNRQFVSQSILSEELQQQIWRRVREEGRSVRRVSVEMGVDMRRVAAVVRLVEVENRMIKEGKSLALPYARAVQSMVPVTQMNPQTHEPYQPHESINDLEQHPITFPQLFYPTSESRAFNRTDAGRVFSGAPRLADEEDVGQGGTPAQEPWQDTKTEIIGRPGRTRPVLKPADSRIPHPHLIAFEKDKLDKSLSYREREIRYRERLRNEEEERKAAKERQAKAEEASKTRIDTPRWQFVVTEVMATRSGTGLDGRGTKSPGNRYGVPSQERKKGTVKIPTKVEV